MKPKSSAGLSFLIYHFAFPKTTPEHCILGLGLTDKHRAGDHPATTIL